MASVYRIVEFVGTSTVSWEDAAKNAVAMARREHSDLRVASVKEFDLTIEGEIVSTYRTKLAISFRYHV